MTSLLERFDLDRRKLLMDRSRPGRMGTTLPPLDVPISDLPDRSMLRDSLDMPGGVGGGDRPGTSRRSASSISR